MKLISEEAPDSMKKWDLTHYFGETIAIDTSICIYQFLAANGDLKNHNDQQTGHILGLLQRTAKYLEAGIKPVYVLEGKPPEMKKGTLDERKLKRQTAEHEFRGIAGLQAAEDIRRTSSVSSVSRLTKKPRVDVASQAYCVQSLINDKDVLEDPSKAAKMKELIKRTTKLTNTHLNDCKRLFGLIGIPVVEAPGEAEAQCVQLCKESKAHAVASEDSDCLPLGTPLLLRNFKADQPVEEYNTTNVLKGLKLSLEEFLDLCILCGCDYCEKIEGVESKEALHLIREHRSIEEILKNTESRFQIPDDWPYAKARELFRDPDVTKDVADLQWTAPKEKELITFLVGEHDFSQDRVELVVKRINNARSLRSQPTIKSFFKRVLPKKTQPTVERFFKPT
ncbi:flap endonuclease 1-B [Triticum aestivum]|nr:flap endonuclease 1-B-like [Triticum aestivum]